MAAAHLAASTSPPVDYKEYELYQAAAARLSAVYIKLKTVGSVDVILGEVFPETFNVRPYDRAVDDKAYGNCDFYGYSRFLPLVIQDRTQDRYFPFIAATGAAMSTVAEWRPARGTGSGHWGPREGRELKVAPFCISADAVEAAIIARDPNAVLRDEKAGPDPTPAGCQLQRQNEICDAAEKESKSFCSVESAMIAGFAMAGAAMGYAIWCALTK